MEKLFILLIVVCVILFVLFILFSFVDLDHDTCFRENIKDGNANEDGCYGLSGGDHNTDYLQYDCIGCPYLKHINKEKYEND